MKIGLIDVDSHNYPNIPLMKLSAWHKGRGDSVEWYQPMFSGHMDKVYVSKVFSFSPDYEYYIDADEVVYGGSGYAISLIDGKEVYDTTKDKTLPYEVEHTYPDYELYGITDTAYGFLTRGCPRGCGFCHVGRKEGRCSFKVAELSEFWRGQKNVVLMDANILACKDHIELLRQLRDSKAKVDINQGLDARLLTDDNTELLRQIRLSNIHIAYDRIQDKEIIEPALRKFKEQTGYDRNHGRVTVFILTNYDTTIEQDIDRIQFCRELNFSPYPMIYNKKNADAVYRRLQRWCNNYIFWKTTRFEDYVV